MRLEGDDPTSFTSRARRAQLLRCAIEAVAERGFTAATLAEIARRAGVSKGVVSYYFSGKEDLLVHVVGDVYARADAAISARVAAATDARGALDAYIDANLRFLAAHPTDVRALIEIVSHLRDGRGEVRARPVGHDPLVAHLEGLLAGDHLGGVADAGQRTSVAVIIRAAIDAAAGRLATDPDFDLDAYADALKSMVGRSTAVRSGRS